MDQPADTDTVFFPNHAQLIIPNFGNNFDIYLCAEDQRFKARKAVLAASSDYFRNRFFDDFENSQENEIKFDLDAKSLKLIVDYVYLGKIELTDENIEGVFKAAHLFQYENICRYITKELSVSSGNCIAMLKIAEVYSLCELNAKTLNYLNQNFSNVWYQKKFLDLNLKDLMSILQSDVLEIYQEEEIFRFVRNWINHDQINRNIHAAELLKLVRLHLMSPEFICKEVRPFYKHYLEISKLIRRAYVALLMPEIMKKLPPRRSFPHTFKDTIILFCIKKKILNIYKLSLSKKHSISYYMSTKFIARCCGITSIDDTIIIAGGHRDGRLSNEVNWFDLKTRKQFLTSTLPSSCSDCHIGVVTNENNSNSIYAFGWKTEPYLTNIYNRLFPTNSVLIWDSNVKNWKPVAAMINKRLYFGSTVLNKKLYVVGGIDENEEYLNSMEMYDPITNKWSECSPMVTKRCSPGVGTIDNYLYVVGGRAENENDNENVSLTSVERYDSLTDTWSFVKSIPVGFSTPSVAGCSNRSLFVTCENAVYRYMQDIDEWFLVTRVRKSLDCIDILAINATF